MKTTAKNIPDRDFLDDLCQMYTEAMAEFHIPTAFTSAFSQWPLKERVDSVKEVIDFFKEHSSEPNPKWDPYALHLQVTLTRYEMQQRLIQGEHITFGAFDFAIEESPSILTLNFESFPFLGNIKLIYDTNACLKAVYRSPGNEVEIYGGSCIKVHDVETFEGRLVSDEEVKASLENLTVTVAEMRRAYVGNRFIPLKPEFDTKRLSSLLEKLEDSREERFKI